MLYLVKEGLLEIPVLYLSRHIVRTKPDYYRLLQAVRETDAWEEWVLYMLVAVASTARETIDTILAIKDLLQRTRQPVRENYKFYSQDLINNLFNVRSALKLKIAGEAALAIGAPSPAMCTRS